MIGSYSLRVDNIHDSSLDTFETSFRGRRLLGCKLQAEGHGVWVKLGGSSTPFRYLLKRGEGDDLTCANVSADSCYLWKHDEHPVAGDPVLQALRLSALLGSLAEPVSEEEMMAA